MRLNLKLLIAAICIVAGVVILWRSFGTPRERTKLFIAPTIQTVAEPVHRPTMIVAQVTDTEPVTATPQLEKITLLLQVEVSGSSNERAQIIYYINDIPYSVGQQDLPWSLLVDITGAQPIKIQARHLADTGTLRCSITQNGETVPANKNESSDPLQLLECSVFNGEK